MYHQEDTITIGTFMEALLLAYLQPLFCFVFKKRAADKANYYKTVIFLILYLTISIIVGKSVLH